MLVDNMTPDKNLFCKVLTLILLLPSLVISAKAADNGDLLYSAGIVGWFPDAQGDWIVGHVGVYDGASHSVIEAMPDPAGVSRVTYGQFVSRKPFFGSRTTNPAPNNSQRSRIVTYATSRLGLPYDDNHFNQKGPQEFDCVGLAELVYEMVGLNPTPDSYETGAGWPLTPNEQFVMLTPSRSAWSGIAQVLPEWGSLARQDIYFLPGIGYDVDEEIEIDFDGSQLLKTGESRSR